jgi:hypothetical protein
MTEINGGMTEPDLVSRAWLLKGLGNTPGILLAGGGLVAFVGEEGPAFEAPLNDVEVSWPRMQMSGGAHFGVGGEKFRVAFVRPNGAADAALGGVVRLGGSLAGAAGVFEIGRLLGSITEGRAAGKRWKEYLARR